MPFSAEIFAELIAAQVQAQLKAIYLPNRNVDGKGEFRSQKLGMESRSSLDGLNQKGKVEPPLPQVEPFFCCRGG
uniref:Uncharacterized protein n=1 Tax=Rhodnius prolixus TaxID=13249 RepID=T1HEY3_RHOPR